MKKLIKPMLAQNIDETKLQFPSYGLITQPKIDGSFAFIQNSKLYSRSLKHHENIYTTESYSKPEYEGFRGELIIGRNPTAEGLCRNTSSALRRVEGAPVTSLYCFDYITDKTVDLPYIERYSILCDMVTFCDNKIKIVHAERIYNLEQYQEVKEYYISLGYEGLILRDPTLPHKEGRSSKTKVHLHRWKPWLDAEILVTCVEEGETNLNEAKINELGRTERSAHKENKKPNGMVGRIRGTLLADLVDISGKVIQKAGEEIVVSPGDMTHKEREFYLENQKEILDKIVKFSYFAYGMKDTVRMPQFKTIRSERDM